jgi:hypothetical protein
VVPTYINGLSEERKKKLCQTSLSPNIVTFRRPNASFFWGGGGGFSISAYVENVKTYNTELSTFISVWKKQMRW